MVGKTYLRYVVGPQGGTVVSNASLSSYSVLARATRAPLPALVTADGSRGVGRRRQNSRAATSTAVLFVPGLESVHVYSVRSGVLQHSLTPANAKMPLEVTTLRVVALEEGKNPTAPPLTSSQQSVTQVDEGGWMLLVGYHNGYIAVFSCGTTSNYGLPVCRFHALGHRIDTAVLSVAVDAQRGCMCSGGQDTDLTVWDLIAQEALFRLRGHRGGVVGVEFVPKQQLGQDDHSLVVTGAADGLIKVWNISIRQCVQTVVASDAQISSLSIDGAGKRLYCGLRESQLKVFNLEGLLDDPDNGTIVEHGGIPRKLNKPITFISFSHDGAFLLACTSKTVEVFRVLSREDILKKVSRKRKRQGTRASAGVDGPNRDDGKGDEMNHEELTPKENISCNGKSDDNNLNGVEKKERSDNKCVSGSTAMEEVSLLRTFFFDEKVRSACFVPPLVGSGVDENGNRRLHIAVTFNNNTVRTFETTLTTTDTQGASVLTLEDLAPRCAMEYGSHQSDIRSLKFVDNDAALVSLSSEKVILWSLSATEPQEELQNVHEYYDALEANVRRNDATGTLICTAQVPLEAAAAADAIASNLCCIGLKDGSVLLVDLPAATVVFSEPAVHVGGVRHVVQRPDKSGFISVGADQRLIVWTLALLKAPSVSGVDPVPEAEEQRNDKKRKGRRKEFDNSTEQGGYGSGEQTGSGEVKGASLQLLQSMQLELTESPLFVACSPDKRLLGVGLQNTNIQLFFADTMKPYLSLYGHKLPATAIDFSTDGTLAASVGMDKALRLWGTDFGDCHRAIHAHDDYVTGVNFLQNTHQLITVSLDGTVKHWDGDNWTMIQMFRQHQRGVWAVAATANSTCIATAGIDKCIRCFLRSSDIVFPEEEEERLAQEAMDEEAARRVAMQNLDQLQEAGVAGHVTAGTVACAEKLMEALDLVSVELQRQENKEDTSRQHPLLVNKTVWEYLWSVIENVRTSELQHALWGLTSTHVDALLNYIEIMLREKAVLNYEIAAKILLSLVSTRATSAGRTIGAAIAGEVSESYGARRLMALRCMIAEGLDRSASRVDYNIAGLQFVRQQLEEKEKTRFFDISKLQGYKKKYHSRALREERTESDWKKHKHRSQNRQ
ncbi:WD domain [Trypanosoma vivax]|uniref:Uncharacterized protein n=1 Tax=Trypanosoma vivax (strain Y486) TaxID=1055687 RepID=G0TYP4_TRYVY|nr:hypothetical protein TRVL_07700 [Trypanosoma vivax]KAH8611162.1 WD domain [Trypanosoma vivax]CCC49093.1 conserved hypothetical protein [Trypanosoma vivax Y486]